MTLILTPAALAVRILIKHCIPLIHGGAQTISPIGGREVPQSEREEIGLTSPGRTYLFPVDNVGVHLDLDGPNATIWFAGADCEDAMVYLRETLPRSYPDLLVQSDEPHRKFAGYRICTLFGPLPNDRACGIEIVYPVRGERRQEDSFVMRITAAARRDAIPPSPGGGLAPGSLPPRRMS